MRIRKKLFEPDTDTVKKTAQEAIGAVKVSSKAIELRGEEINKAINEVGYLIKSTTNFDL